MIEDIRADGKSITCDPRATLHIPATHHHSVEFQFTVCDFAAPERVLFRTRLAGMSDGWSEPMRNRSVSYFNLRPGNYRFEVMAADQRHLEHPAGHNRVCG